MDNTVEKDATKVVKEFKNIMTRAKSGEEHLFVTVARLYKLFDDTENLFHEEDFQ